MFSVLIPLDDSTMMKGSRKSSDQSQQQPVDGGRGSDIAPGGVSGQQQHHHGGGAGQTSIANNTAGGEAFYPTNFTNFNNAGSSSFGGLDDNQNSFGGSGVAATGTAAFRNIGDLGAGNESDRHMMNPHQASGGGLPEQQLPDLHNSSVLQDRDAVLQMLSNQLALQSALAGQLPGYVGNNDAQIPPVHLNPTNLQQQYAAALNNQTGSWFPLGQGFQLPTTNMQQQQMGGSTNAAAGTGRGDTFVHYGNVGTTLSGRAGKKASSNTDLPPTKKARTGSSSSSTKGSNDRKEQKGIDATSGRIADRRYNNPVSSMSLVASARADNNQTANQKLQGIRPIPMFLSCDEESLSEYQCFLRQQIELFEATNDDLQLNAQKMNKSVVLGQVGIRCRHCAQVPPWTRARGAVYYSATLDGLYQAGQNMSKNHLSHHCTSMPDPLKQRLLDLKESKRRAGGGKQYWSEAARALGVYEDQYGLRFRNRNKK